MNDLLLALWDMLIGRDHGPLALRLVIQPIVAAILGILAGVRDARAGQSAYGWNFLTQPGRRVELMRAGWKDLMKLFFVAVVIDVIYELYVFRWVYPGQALIVAAVVAFPSYFFIRSLTNRIARPWVSTTASLQAPAGKESISGR